jgi:predicted metal-dependent hydrolase
MPTPRRLQRDRIDYPLDADRRIEIERVRDPRARRIRLLVGERGVRLTVPRGASLREAESFLLRQHDWLRLQLDRRAAMPVPPALERGRTASIPLRGAMLPLQWDVARYASTEHTGDALVLRLPERAPDATVGRLLRQFYGSEAHRDLAAWLPKYLKGLPRPPSAFRFSPLSSLWGSLSPRGAVSLDLSLVLGPPSAFEYVLVHELCHLLQPNHSPAFWKEVSTRWPDWRRDRDWLRGEGMQQKAALGAMLR